MGLIQNTVKVTQNTVDTGRFDKNTKIHTEPFIVPKRFASNIVISTSNSCELLSENSENVLEANHDLSTEINNTMKDKNPQEITEPSIKDTD